MRADFNYAICGIISRTIAESWFRDAVIFSWKTSFAQKNTESYVLSLRCNAQMSIVSR